MAAPGPLTAPWTPRRQRGPSIFEEDNRDGEWEPIVSFDYSAAEEVIQAFPVEAFCRSETFKAPFLEYVRAARLTS